ncbi:MAG: hypothetical protein IBJ11_12115, partial [Phycisphaerales bacterium]|nr:hypothetical protein [Phycisphaerales bacterium]
MTEPPRRNSPLPLVACTLVVVAAAAVLRGLINMPGELAPGMDAAYYPVQARAMLEQGRLAYHDLPITFAIIAGAARVLMLITPMDIDAATLAASRWSDTLLPPLAAVPLMLLGWSWTPPDRRGWRSAAGFACAAAVAVLAMPALRMAGDFQKNALGLVWIGFAAWAAHRAMARPTVARWLAAAAFIGLAAGTHVGAFGAAAVLLAVAVAWWVVVGGGWSIRRLAVVTLSGSALAAALFGIIAWASPRRAQSLLQAPAKLFGSSGGEGGPGGPGGPGGGLLTPFTLGAAAIYLLGALVLWRLWRDRRSLSPAESGVAVGAAACAGLLIFPLINGEYLMRLSLMSPLPAAILLVFLLARREHRAAVRWPAPLLGLAASLSAALAFGLVPMPMPTPGPGGAMGRPPPGLAGPMDARRPPRGPGGPGGVAPRVVPDEAAPEFRRMRELIVDPKRTVVIARHGLEWWAAYFLRTAAWPREPDDAFQRYDRVLYIEELRRGPGGMGGPRGLG